MKRITALTVGLIAMAITAAAAGAAPASSTSALPVLALTMTGNSITAPSTIGAGAVTVTSTVSGEASGAPILVRLDPGVTFAQAFGSVQSHHGDPNALDGLASIIYSVQADKGTSSAQTVLTPGNYVAVDTTKGNPAKWPQTTFTVTASSSPAPLPKAAATVAMIEFGFTGPSTLHDGELVQFVNKGYLVHMAIGIGVSSKKNAKKVSALLLAGKDSQAQKLATSFVTFVGTASSGGLQQQVITAKPGIYVLACFMDTQDGREHTRLGMERTIKITK